MSNIIPHESQFLLYSNPGGDVRLEALVRGETVWLTQQKIADLFGVDRSVITKHLKNIYNDGEFSKKSTCAIFAHVQLEGSREVKRNIKFKNLDAKYHNY
ncbi:hypothetical protein KJ656_07805 [bacterium]|nr:hypothetical protein [bacterium]